MQELGNFIYHQVFNFPFHYMLNEVNDKYTCQHHNTLFKPWYTEAWLDFGKILIQRPLYVPAEGPKS